MKRLISVVLLTVSSGLAVPALAREVNVEVIDLTNGIDFAPMLIATHDADTHLFIPGTPGIPAAPGGSGVAGTDTSTTVHSHCGILGDTDLGGGASNLDGRVHRWLNPVARVILTIDVASAAPCGRVYIREDSQLTRRSNTKPLVNHHA